MDTHRTSVRAVLRVFAACGAVGALGAGSPPAMAEPAADWVHLAGVSPSANQRGIATAVRDGLDCTRRLPH